MPVYFMQSVEGGSVKIGHSVDVDRRRESLEYAYGTPLTVLATMDGGREEEQAVHARFSHLRLGRTEQFQPAPDLMAFIGRPLLVDQDSGAVEAMPSLIDPMIVQMRGSAEFKAYVQRGADFARQPIAKMAELAIIQHLRSIGFTEEPPKR